MEYTLVGRTEINKILCDCAMWPDESIRELPISPGLIPRYSAAPGTTVGGPWESLRQLGADGAQLERLVRAAKPWRMERGSFEQQYLRNGEPETRRCTRWWSPGIFADQLRWYPTEEAGGPLKLAGERMPSSAFTPNDSIQKEVVITQFPLYRSDDADGTIRYTWRGPSEGGGPVGFGTGMKIKFNETLSRYPIGGPPVCLPTGTVLGLLTAPHMYGIYWDPESNMQVQVGLLKIGSIIRLADEEVLLDGDARAKTQTDLARKILARMDDKRPIGGGLWLKVKLLSPFLINSLKTVGWPYAYKKGMPYYGTGGRTESVEDIANRLASDVVAGGSQFYTELLGKL